MKTKLIVIVCLVLVCFPGGGCAHAPDFDTQLGSIVKPYSFNIVQWQSRAIPQEVNQWLWGRDEKIDDEVQVVTEYFSSVERIKTLKSEVKAINTGSGQGDLASIKAELNILQERRTALEDTVEGIIEKQIIEALAQEGIFNPVDEYIRLKVSFPPLNFELEEPPHLLVISPRERIESMREIALQQNISLREIEDIEAEVDKLEVSSLVVALGGLGATYPTFVTDDAGLRFTIDTATEEWLHQYLVFKPLGFLYLLDLTGVLINYEIATMNETLASMVSKEIGSIVYRQYYAEYENNGAYRDRETDVESVFNREMREIRRAVDNYLAQGEIEQAEEFMEQKRQYLVSMG